MAVPFLIIIPTYNESGNIQSIVQAIYDLPLRDPPAVLIVDDHSPDGTGDIAERLREKFPLVSVLHRENKAGLGEAYRAGFRWALDRSFAWIIQMDADFSHDPKYLVALENMIQNQRADVFIGSRYVAGGAVAGWSTSRRLLSRCGNVLARAILKCAISDMTSGFGAWRTEVLSRIDISTLRSEGYVFQIELKRRAIQAGFRCIEFPITFPDRKVGRSKMSPRIAWEAVRWLARVFFRKES